MGTKLTSIMKTTSVFLLSSVVLFNSTTVLASGKKDLKTKEQKIESMAANLEQGIKSENIGLKKSCIYYTGFYKIPDADDILLKQLKKEKNPEVRTLIVLSLFKVGSEKGYKSIRSLAEKDEDENVRKTCKEICNAFTNIVDKKIAQISN